MVTITNFLVLILLSSFTIASFLIADAENKEKRKENDREKSF
ncbi:MAG: hypothetical protein ACOC22_04065 [bacterium]